MQAFLDQPCVSPSGSVRLRLARPLSRHQSVRTEGVGLRWHAPEPAEQPGDNDILVRLWQTAEWRSRLAALKQHRVEIVVRCQELHHWIAVPEAECLDLVLRFH